MDYEYEYQGEPNEPEFDLEAVRFGRDGYSFLLSDGSSQKAAKLLKTRYGAAAQKAIQRVTSGEVLSSLPGNEREGHLEGLRRMSAICTQGYDSIAPAHSYWGAEALDDALETDTSRMAAERAQFKKCIASELGKMPSILAVRVEQILKDIVSASQIIGIEQGEGFRQVRVDLQELAIYPECEGRPLLSLLSGWATLWSGSHSEEALGHFAHAASLAQAEEAVLAAACNRYFAMALSRDGQNPEALGYARAALNLNGSSELYLEAARYAVQASRPGEARKYVDQAIVASPLLMAVALSDPALDGADGGVLGGYIHAIQRLRQFTLESVEVWQSNLTRVLACEKALGVGLEMPVDLVTGLSDIGESLPQADLFEALGLYSAARRNGLDAIAVAEHRMEAEIVRRKRNGEAVRGKMELARQEREDAIKAAMGNRSEMSEKTQAALAKSRIEGERAQTGCSVGMGLGCGVFLLYLVTASILTFKGVRTGIDTSFGLTAMGLVAFPIVVALIGQIAFSIRRMRLDAEVDRQMQVAKSFYLIASRKIDKIFNLRLEALFKEMSQAEASLARAEEALRVLRQPTPVASQPPASPRLPRAS